jgi:hypothetical protein
MINSILFICFVGVKNKYCVICQRFKNKILDGTASIECPPHDCTKNYDGSSTAIEADTAVEGFLSSLKLYGVIYKKFIGDGDSSVYAKILKANPYGKEIIVNKIECRNHLLRNLRTKLNNVITNKTKNINGKSFGIIFRKLLGLNFGRILRDVRTAIQFRKNQDGEIAVRIENLKKDLLNIPFHIFGAHKKCDRYFCEGPKNYLECVCFCECKEHCNCKPKCECLNNCVCKSGVCKCMNECICIVVCKCSSKCYCKCKRRCVEVNNVPKMIDDGIFIEVQKYLKLLSDHSSSLILDVDSNPVEQFHSTVAKHNGGKRINNCLGMSYTMRCMAAVVQFNTKASVSYMLDTIFGAQQEESILSKMYHNRMKPKKPAKKRFPLEKSTQNNKDYGPRSEQPATPDFTNDMMEQGKEKLMEKLLNYQKNRDVIQMLTIEQSDSTLWTECRKSMVTASHFGPICKSTTDHSFSVKVKKVIYSTSISHVPAIKFGKENEDIARKQLEKQLKIKINKCGLFIDPIHAFLGASPDGIVEGEDAIVEIKCLFAACQMNIDDAIKTGVTKHWKLVANGTISNYELNKNDDWYFQIQGQIHIANKSFCYFAAWTSEEQSMKVEKIFRDDDFWDKKMLPKLLKFFNSHLAPEIIDPRYYRELPLRHEILKKKKYLQF